MLLNGLCVRLVSILSFITILDYMVWRSSRVGPFFVFADGSFLAHNRFVQSVQSALDALGINSSLYAGDSFCIAVATKNCYHQESGYMGKLSIHHIYPNFM